MVWHVCDDGEREWVQNSKTRREVQEESEQQLLWRRLRELKLWLIGFAQLRFPACQPSQFFSMEREHDQANFCESSG
jgi:hypothetical protein